MFNKINLYLKKLFIYNNVLLSVHLNVCRDVQTTPACSCLFVQLRGPFSVSICNWCSFLTAVGELLSCTDRVMISSVLSFL